MKSFKQWYRSRLVAALRGMQEREVREVIKEAWPGYCLARIGDKGKRKEKGNAAEVVHLP